MDLLYHFHDIRKCRSASTPKIGNSLGRPILDDRIASTPEIGNSFGRPVLDDRTASTPEVGNSIRRRFVDDRITSASKADKSLDQDVLDEGGYAVKEADEPVKHRRKQATHPTTGEMVLQSIEALKMRNGAPAETIRQHIAENYEVDMKKMKPLIKRCLVVNVEKEVLVQVKGVGGRDKFKISKAVRVKRAKEAGRGKKKNIENSSDNRALKGPEEPEIQSTSSIPKSSQKLIQPEAGIIHPRKAPAFMPSKLMFNVLYGGMF